MDHVDHDGETRAARCPRGDKVLDTRAARGPSARCAARALPREFDGKAPRALGRAARTTKGCPGSSRRDPRFRKRPRRRARTRATAAAAAAGPRPPTRPAGAARRERGRRREADDDDLEPGGILQRLGVGLRHVWPFGRRDGDGADGDGGGRERAAGA